MRRWCAPFAYPNKTAAWVFTSNPIRVRTFGLMRDSASRRTIESSSTPQARPTPLVQVIRWGSQAVRRRSDLGRAPLQPCPQAPYLNRALAPEGLAPSIGLQCNESCSFRFPLRFGFQFRKLSFGKVVHSRELQDLHFAASARRDDRGSVANFLVQQGAADGRGGGDFAGSHVGLFAGHELVFHFFILSAVVDGHRRTETDLILGDVVQVDQREVRQALAQLADARLQVLLALL